MSDNTAPTRATHKGHGSPDTLVYYGYYSAPAATGVLVRVTKGLRGWVMTSVETGETVDAGGWAGKFWAAQDVAPVPAPAEPTPAQTKALVFGLIDQAYNGRDFADLCGTGARRDMITRMQAAGWVEDKHGIGYPSITFRITRAGRDAVAHLIPQRAIDRAHAAALEIDHARSERREDFRTYQRESPSVDAQNGYTHPDVFAAIERGEADPILDPRKIDWSERQAHAAVPFDVIDGRPVNPSGPTAIRYGRNELWHWGEAQTADAAVMLRVFGERWLLMVERADGSGWALPGGFLDAGEAAREAASRELREETGLVVSPARWKALPARVVPDPRASGEAWVVTTPHVAEVDATYGTTAVRAGDDARRVWWFPAGSFQEVKSYLSLRFRGTIFPAHETLLREILDR